VVIPLPDGFTALERRDLFSGQRSVLQQRGRNAPDLISHRMCAHQAVGGVTSLPDASADHDQIASAGEIHVDYDPARLVAGEQLGRNVRFTPNSGHWNSVSKCPLCARSGSRRNQISGTKRCSSNMIVAVPQKSTNEKPAFNFAMRIDVDQSHNPAKTIVLDPAYVQRLDFCTEILSVCAILAADVCHRILVRWRSS
jgi:hypothetical protein